MKETFGRRIMRSTHEVHIRLLETKGVQAIQFGCRGTPQRRMDIVAAGSAQLNGKAVHQHTVFYNLHVTETDLLAEAADFLAFLTKRNR